MRINTNPHAAAFSNGFPGVEMAKVFGAAERSHIADVRLVLGRVRARQTSVRGSLRASAVPYPHSSLLFYVPGLLL